VDSILVDAGVGSPPGSAALRAIAADGFGALNLKRMVRLF
jgi:hypothetical protein